MASTSFFITFLLFDFCKINRVFPLGVINVRVKYEFDMCNGVPVTRNTSFGVQQRRRRDRKHNIHDFLVLFRVYNDILED